MTNKEKIRQNIISFEKAKQALQRKITTKDINALFLGLANIVRKNAMEEANSELKKECLDAKENFRTTLIDLNNTQKLLKKSEQEKLILAQKVENLQKQVCFLLANAGGNATKQNLV